MFAISIHSSALSEALGLDRGALDLTFGQICLRAVVIFFSGLVLVRVAHKRFFAKKSAFDVLLAFILGSILGRAITGSERLFETIGACFLLLLLHRMLGFLAFKWPRFECLVKGNTNVLVKDGEVISERLSTHRITPEDLKEQLRLQGNVSDPEEVSLACLERSGEISVVRKEGGT